MREAYAATGQNDKSAPIHGGYGISAPDTLSSIHEFITDIFKREQPYKTWALIADLLNLKEHAAKHRAANQRPYTVEELRMLLRSDLGGEILEELMTDAKPQWWAGVESAMKIAAARHHHELARQEVLSLEATPLEMPTRRKLKRTVDADRNITSGIARQETALGFLLANGSGAQNSAVAQAKGQQQTRLRNTGGRR